MNFKYHCGAGGLGDFLLSLTTFYDNDNEHNIIWFADNKQLIEEASKLFPKLKNKLIFSKNEDYNKFGAIWLNYTQNSNCLSTCITPKRLDYVEWYKVDVFEKYNVNENPKFVENFYDDNFDKIEKVIDKNENYVCVMPYANSLEHKKKIILEHNLEDIINENDNIFLVGKDNNVLKKYSKLFIDATNLNLASQMYLIANSNKTYSVDSWIKTWSSLNGIETYCYDNIYREGNYLNLFKDHIDYGHYVFIFPFKKIKFIKQ